MIHKRRVLVVSHSAVYYSGVAEVVRRVVGSVLRKYPEKYEVLQLGLGHISAVTAPLWDIIPTRVCRMADGSQRLRPEDIDGEMSFPVLLNRFEPDLVFAHNDPQRLRYLCQDYPDRNWSLVLYVPFDGMPVPPGFDDLLNADALVTMSVFSRDAFAKSLATGNAAARDRILVRYVPADTQRIYPIARAEGQALRRKHLPAWMPCDAFIVGWIGRNQWRKQVWAVYSVIGRLRAGDYFVCSSCGGVVSGLGTDTHCGCPASNLQRAEPLSDIYLWMHMPVGKEAGEWPLDELERMYGVLPGRDVHYTAGCSARAHLHNDDIPGLYHLWDMLLFLSGGEGFGVPAWDAMASAVPIVVPWLT